MVSSSEPRGIPNEIKGTFYKGKSENFKFVYSAHENMFCSADRAEQLLKKCEFCGLSLETNFQFNQQNISNQKTVCAVQHISKKHTQLQCVHTN